MREEIKYFEKRTDVVSYLNEVIPAIKNEKITGVYFHDESNFISGSLHFERDNTATTIEKGIAIVFENYFLYVHTVFASSLSIGLCPLTDDDRKEMAELKDLLNSETFVYGPGYKIRCVAATGNIGRIMRADVEVLDHPIEAWVRKNGVSHLEENVVYEDGFNRITLFFESGNAMRFIAEDAMFDGYMDFQIKDIDYYEVEMEDPEDVYNHIVG